MGIALSVTLLTVGPIALSGGPAASRNERSALTSFMWELICDCVRRFRPV